MLVDFSRLSNILEVVTLCSIFVTPVSITLSLPSVICSMDASFYDSTTKLPKSFYVQMLGYFLLSTSFIVTLQIQTLPNPSCSNYTHYTIYFISLIIANLNVTFGMLSSPVAILSCIIFIANELDIILNSNSMSVENIKGLICKLRNTSTGIGNISVLFFMALQTSFIFGIYLVLTFKGTFPMYAVMFVAMNHSFILVFLNKIEEIYEQVSQIACKAREESADRKSISEMTKIQAAVIELETCVPFTGMGYFTIEKSTLTAMAANTLTYLIVLIQFNWG